MERHLIDWKKLLLVGALIGDIILVSALVVSLASRPAIPDTNAAFREALSQAQKACTKDNQKDSEVDCTQLKLTGIDYNRVDYTHWYVYFQADNLKTNVRWQATVDLSTSYALRNIQTSVDHCKKINGIACEIN